MKAILLTDFGDAENLTYADAPCPKPGPGQLCIKVAATSVNRPDLMQREGQYPPPPGESEILGLEAAGTVVELGEGVTDWQVGERVMALLGGGGYAQYAVANAAHAMRIPDAMNFAQAACVCETYLTAYLNLFLIGGVSTAKTLLLHGGGGGVNTAALQLTRQLAPNCQVLVTASSRKVARVLALGADVVIDYQREDFATRVREITESRGVEVILDHLGAAYLEANLKCLAVGGTLLLIGILGGARAEINLGRLLVKRQSIVGSVLRSRPFAEKAELIAQFSQTVLPLFATAKIAPLISETFGLRDAAEAHRHMQSSQHFGKIVLRVD